RPRRVDGTGARARRTRARVRDLVPPRQPRLRAPTARRGIRTAPPAGRWPRGQERAAPPAVAATGAEPEPTPPTAVRRRPLCKATRRPGQAPAERPPRTRTPG